MSSSLQRLGTPELLTLDELRRALTSAARPGETLSLFLSRIGDFTIGYDDWIALLTTKETKQP